MKYESSILKRLIDTYGVIGNPRYLSEIIKEFIVQGKECYPNLFTYQSDWLAHIDEFGLTPEYTVSYTGQQIYAPNTKERPVKRAILKGNTLENLTYGVQLPLTQNSVDFRVKGMESGKKYTIFYDVEAASSTNLPKVGIIGQAKENSGANWLIYQSNIPLGTGKVVLTMPSFYSISFLRIHKNDSLNEPITLNNLMLLEGDYTNDDIPFFDGIQSVKMPGLTTSNEDGTKTNILTVNEDVTLRSNGDVCDELDLLTGKLTQRIDEDGEVLVQEVVKTVDLTILDQNGQNVKQLMSFNGGTHFTTSSQEGSLLPSLCVDVVTDLEETLKVCSLEGNTM